MSADLPTASGVEIVAEGLVRIDSFVTGTNMPLALYLVDGVVGVPAASGDAGEVGEVSPAGSWLLTDTGCVGMVDELVLPALERLQPGASIGSAVVCHAHADHFGGNAELLAANESCIVYAHEKDLAWARDPARHIRESYDRLEPEFSTPAAAKQWVAGLLGPPTPVTALADGDRFTLEDGGVLEVVPLPGHSPGHIGLWNESRGVLLASDALLGDGQWAGGRLDAIPSYLDVDAYLGSIAKIRGLDPELLCTAHFPLMRGAAAREFCDLSEDFVHRLESELRKALAQGGQRTLEELTMEIVPRTAPGVTPGITAAFSVQAHLDRLHHGGEAVASKRGGIRVWSAA